MSAPAKPAAMPAAPATEELLGDYRKALRKNYVGRWDLQNPDGTYRDVVVTIESVHKYVPPAHILRKKVKQAEKTGKPIAPEFIVRFAAQRKGWIVRNEMISSIGEALKDPVVKNWKGKKIALHFDPSIMCMGQRVGGLRAVRVGGQAVERQLEAEPNEADVAMLEAAFREERDDFSDADESQGGA